MVYQIELRSDQSIIFLTGNKVHTPSMISAWNKLFSIYIYIYINDNENNVVGVGIFLAPDREPYAIWWSPEGPVDKLVVRAKRIIQRHPSTYIQTHPFLFFSLYQ